MKGWKTWLSALVMVGSAVATGVGHPEIADATVKVAAALGMIGLGHKIEKAAPTDSKG